MALFFEILSGDLQGNRTPVRDGLIIGRKRGGLTIKDSKISSEHARVEHRPDGTFWLVDLGSSNGIKFGDLRVREIKLDTGATFTIGRTSFQIISSEDGAQEVHEDQPTATNAPVTVTRTLWDNVRELADRGARTAKTQKREVLPFDPVVKLKFIRGIQSGTEWTIGYGPRMIGTASLDLMLEDTALPAQCFRLEPQHKAVLFKNETSREVRLNGKYVASETLKNGDIIEIMNTQIQVELDG